MEPGTLGSFLLGVVFLLPVILITVLCVGCWGYKSSNARIPQNIADYEDEPNFRVVRPNTFPQQSNHKPNTLQPSFHSTAHTGVTSSSPVHTLSPVVNSRRTSATPQEDNESVPSYENEENEAVDVGDYVNEEDEQPGEGYIEVLPDAPAPVCGSVSQQSLMSAASSANENYVNLKEDDAASENFESNSGNYVNLEEEKDAVLRTGSSLDNVNDSEDDGSSDYVNAPQQPFRISSLDRHHFV
ncbi:linker for activation of T-cells family member 1-like isoform X1 [Lepisosteus oculatus]|uniref:linker for activation of T-cells family member 1-like isoform X1 n=1 Tax=Lepisosteus oculatus TaxID=7918 RepID=UPI00371AF64B